MTELITIYLPRMFHSLCRFECDRHFLLASSHAGRMPEPFWQKQLAIKFNGSSPQKQEMLCPLGKPIPELT